MVEFLEVPSILVNIKILLREHGTEWAGLLLGDGLEWAKVHNSVDIVGIEVRPQGNGVETNRDLASRGVDERPHFVL